MSLAVSIVVPLYNAEERIGDVLESIFNEDYPAPVEVIVVNDGSTDGSLEVLTELRQKWDFQVIDQPNQGAARASNNGFKAASHDIICSVDSDVVLARDWIKKIAEEFSDPEVGAVQGYIETPEGVPLLSRLAGYDLEKRYDGLTSKYVTQVSTSNTAYRRAALDKAGLFDPAFKYGYDNDMSYRLQEAGYRLVFREDARCEHYWKTELKGYIKQQYHSAYGRMQLVRKYRGRVTGDSVSGLRMIVQVPLTILLVLFFLSGAVLALGFTPGAGRYLLLAALGVLGAIFVDRTAFALGVFKKHKDPAAFLMPFVHILRNVVWSWAFLRWVLESRQTGKQG